MERHELPLCPKQTFMRRACDGRAVVCGAGATNRGATARVAAILFGSFYSRPAGNTLAFCFMKTKSYLESSDVKSIAQAAEAEAVANQWAVTIAITDDAGHLLWLQRMDGAAAVSAHIAPAKANTAALGRRESRVYEEMVNGGRASFMTAPLLQGLLEGGVPIIKDGQVIGAVGVSGVKSDQDAQVAKAGIAALSL